MSQLEIPFPELSTPATLAEAYAFYHDANSDHPHRSGIRSAFKAMSRAIGLPLDQIPADVVRLRALLATASPARAGVKPMSWKSMKCLALRALREAGVELASGRDTSEMSPAWRALIDRAETRVGIGLGRFAKFLTRIGVEPDAITADAFAAWRGELLDTSLRANPETSYRQMVRLWKACEHKVPGWPQVPMESPEDPRRFSLAWDAFPKTLRVEVDAFLFSRLHPDPLSPDPAPKVRPATSKTREKNLRAFATALVLSGEVPIDEVRQLAVLTQPVNIRMALGYLRNERFGKEVRPQLLNHAELMKTIARHWEKDLPKAEQIGLLIKSLKGALGQASGMTDKNRARLVPFDDQDNVKRLLELPQRTLKRAADAPRSHLTAVRVMYATQVALLMAVPLRAKNLTGLKLGENLIESGKGKTRQVRLFLSREETKTHSDFTAVLPARVVTLLDAWQEDWRPLVSNQASPYLFPNASGLLRSQGSLSSKICRFVERETGLKMHLHLFRHLAAKLYLRFDPGGLETVRQLLGHKSIKTTLKAYADFQTEPAFIRLEEALLDLYAAPRPKRKTSR
ncbi:integrase [Brevundimonas alba]|uniref:Integrase n=1 Tax=Brevundimonas alba TaxID=74314 RepID=A0A7X5YKP9_9CAUL|nr:site-specific integrase [Brevundimonas alba]NJC41700.1 integrase [Brevundimonas alba]